MPGNQETLKRVKVTPYYRGLTDSQDRRRKSQYFTEHKREARLYGPQVITVRIMPNRPLFAETAVDAAQKLGVRLKYLNLAGSDVVAADNLIHVAAKKKGFDCIIRRGGDWVQVIKPSIIKALKPGGSSRKGGRLMLSGGRLVKQKRRTVLG